MRTSLSPTHPDFIGIATIPLGRAVGRVCTNLRCESRRGERGGRGKGKPRTETTQSPGRRVRTLDTESSGCRILIAIRSERSNTSRWFPAYCRTALWSLFYTQMQRERCVRQCMCSCTRFCRMLIHFLNSCGRGNCSQSTSSSF